jgi:putative lipoic acid-binding regulatory protein
MKRFPEDSQPDIRYPTWWTYTVIGLDREQLETAIAEVVEERSRKVSLSNVSSAGRYCSLRLELIVLDEDERKKIYDLLRDHPVVKYVL